MFHEVHLLNDQAIHIHRILGIEIPKTTAFIDHMRRLGVDPNQVKPALKELYGATQTRVDDALFNQMDAMRTVRAFNLDDLDAPEDADNTS